MTRSPSPSDPDRRDDEPGGGWRDVLIVLAVVLGLLVAGIVVWVALGPLTVEPM